VCPCYTHEQVGPVYSTMLADFLWILTLGLEVWGPFPVKNRGIFCTVAEVSVPASQRGIGFCSNSRHDNCEPSSPGPGICIIPRIGTSMKHARFRIDDDHGHFAH